jgi:N-acetylglucosamine-6-phosphate deacetylase
MMTATPAAIMNLPHKGHIAPGMDADFVVFDENIRIKNVFARGFIVDP